ncbi:MAG TPA: aromatic ring-hydroxylating dioxygenase subunit alpha [Candidatus Binataceae bacterium]|nr:aromatic ring-hydroxylating dioxygenase subunit alpha [Candidatus Binataceae bacterium]HVB80049.1 aromatic ring-hydroxylating dioxygenase subunit alpha [Candidatus Binataceae bacterium]
MENGRMRSLVIDDPKRCLFQVHRTAYTSPEILELERERVFDRSWIYVGHESEVRNRGDFQSRDVAGRPVILCRDSDGELRVLINSCTHRGAQLCREAEGNARTFQCFYHAWTFNNRGELVGVPDAAGYGPAFDKAELGLKSLPRLTNYRGLIFVSFDPNIEDFVTYLANAKEQLDLIMDQAAAGMEIVGGTHLYSSHANWKMLVENSLESYHVAPLHKSYIDYLRVVGNDVSQAPVRGFGRELGNGNAVEEYEGNWGRPQLRWDPRWGDEAKREIEANRRRLTARFGEQRALRIAEWNRNVLVYPNLMINDIMGITIRTFYPVAPDYMEVRAWSMAPADESPAWRARRLDNFLTFLGPGGLSTPDDNEAMESCQRGFRAAREVEWSDMSRGIVRESQAVDEEQLRSFWRKWNAQVSGSKRTRSSSAKVRRVA